MSGPCIEPVNKPKSELSIEYFLKEKKNNGKNSICK